MLNKVKNKISEQKHTTNATVKRQLIGTVDDVKFDEKWNCFVQYLGVTTKYRIHYLILRHDAYSEADLYENKDTTIEDMEPFVSIGSFYKRIEDCVHFSDDVKIRIRKKLQTICHAVKST